MIARLRTPAAVHWVDLQSPESPGDNLRHQGADKGALLFARGEGIHMGRGELYFTCTSGGAAKLGQIMRLRPGRGTRADALDLFFESTSPDQFNYGDNLTIAPGGDLYVCEDQYTDVVDNYIRGIHPDGTPRTLSVRAARLDDAHGRYRRDPGSAPVAVVFADVTEERAQHDYLAGFAGMVAHDLRSPLTTVRGWLDMCQVMLESDPHTPTADLGEPLSRATAGAVQMGRLIDDLMSHVSAHGQVLELEPVDLASLARDVAEAHGVGDALTVGEVPQVWADRALVDQLVTNLVGNAAKYRHPERPLALTLRGEERHGLVTLVLEDNGRGIPAADADKVFERFYRVEEHRDAGTGTGLGLAMCRTIVERHGGTIRVLPRPVGAGAALEVVLAAVPLPVTARPVHGPDPLDALGPQRRHLRTVTD